MAAVLPGAMPAPQDRCEAIASILIVEADAQERTGGVMAELCRRGGHRVHQTGNVIDAMGTLEADHSIGVVAVGIPASRANGLALVERLRRCADHGVQFIVMSPTRCADDIVRAMHLKVADFVTEPGDETRLRMALTRALDGWRGGLGSYPRPRCGAALPPGDALDVLEEAYRHGLALMERVQSLRMEQAGGVAPVSAHTPAPQPVEAPAQTSAARGRPVTVRLVESGVETRNDAERLGKLLAIQKKRAVRNNFFCQGLFDDPCWDMLLDLMVNHLQGRRISVSSLCIASGVAQTTALRRINDLNKSGLVRRIADESDGRRVFIELTEQGIAAMSKYADSI